jgi:hypothetical protein
VAGTSLVLGLCLWPLWRMVAAGLQPEARAEPSGLLVELTVLAAVDAEAALEDEAATQTCW